VVDADTEIVPIVIGNEIGARRVGVREVDVLQEQVFIL
jgi:hypothetical protein